MDRVVKEGAAESGEMPVLLRRALLADAVVSGGAGIGWTLGAEPLGEVLGLPVGLLRRAGLVALAWAAVAAHVGTRERVARSVVWVVIGGNLVWAVGSVLLVSAWWVEPTAAGYAFVIGQAVAVGLLAEAQYVGWRRMAPTLAKRAAG